MTDLESIRTVLRQTAARLEDVSDSGRLDAEILLARAIDMPRSYLFAHPEDSIDDAAIERLEKTVQQRLSGEPMAYIAGIKEFWSLELMVTPATLVPRPETEILVDRALCEIPRDADWRILDLGTGCGAIALAIASDRQLCDVTGVDISAEALAVAEQNARQLSLSNVSFLEGNWTEPVANQQFKVICSNPPYIAAGDGALAALTAEPKLALASGEHGFDAIKLLARDCVSIIADDGLLFLEHGATQKDQVAEILKSYGWTSIQCYDDFAGHPRVTCSHFPSSETP
ncbi:MAG: peptide chain release factor N(5)-glutamine methyltransferase [Desulfobulbaceae bacterium]|nr:peptide chain release factor N(5)-glutamine methyltransferase [Desulfobulbaceae bacterium]